MAKTPLPQANRVQTATGRAVSFYEYGSPTGDPVIALHGTPASGAGFSWTDAPARARNLRVLAPDRPGVGRSDPMPRGVTLRVTDYPDELAAFADALDVGPFTLLGYSGGGPYALAAARTLTDRVKGAAIVASAGNVGEWAKLSEFNRTDRYMTLVADRAPLVARAALASSNLVAHVAPRISLRLAMAEMTPPDKEAMRTFPDARAALHLFTAACKGGTRGVVDDYAAVGRPWEFPVEEIRVPVHVWHASDDILVPPRYSEALAARIPGARLTLWPDEGHLGILGHVGEVFDELRSVTGS